MTDILNQNRLDGETSPYLLQHAGNPVHWQPWDDAALTAARAQDRPVLLSIGYSACHWCHVMAHESFEDPATAALMNEHFVNIKVDREERPDLDKIYQTAHQLLTQRGGGWPLTVFLDPEDLTPFFAGTYFPREPHYGMPGFNDLLERVAKVFHEQRGQLQKQNAALRATFERLTPAASAEAPELKATLIDHCRERLAAEFDRNFGGFGPAPKFPHATSLDFLLRDGCDATIAPEARAESREMLTITLQHMAEGGIFDQLGGGFCRYSVDQYWLIPHFEKMLYDNGPLLGLYAQAWRLTGDDAFKATAEQSAAWLLREMRSPEGGFYASLDADSEGEEGRYYVWDRAEIAEQLSDAEYAAFAHRFELDGPPNFESHWHLHINRSFAAIAEALGESEQEVGEKLKAAQDKLLKVRAARVPPGRDDKQLTSWNALAVGGLALAGRLLARPDYIDAARAATDFIQRSLWRDGRLLASYKDGRAQFQAYLDDYAFLLAALIELLQARWDSQLLIFARQLAEVLLAHFEDREAGGFWFTADDHEALLHRPKTFADESMASGNGMAARALIRLGHLLGESRYLDAAANTLKAAAPALSAYPQAHTSLMNALRLHFVPPSLAIIRGEPDAMAAWQQALEQSFDPDRLSFAIPADAEDLTGTPAACRPQGKTCAYVCTGTQCSPPVSSPEALRALL
jgi:uncharacterized protein YyaL (SSP411 family)